MDPVLGTLRTQLWNAGRSILKGYWRMSAPQVSFSRIIYPERGEGLVAHGGREFLIRPGRLYLVPAGRKVRTEDPKLLQISFCRFTATVLGGMNLFSYMDCCCEVVCRDRPLIERCFNRMRRISARQSENTPMTVEDGISADGFLRLLLAPFMATASMERQNSAPEGITRFAAVVSHIQGRLHDPLRVTDLAKLTNMEPTYFTRLFTRHVGFPPVRYIQRQRIEAVQRLLWETNETLDSIAERTGFCSAFHLSKTFKKITGASPSHFREAGSMDRL